ERRVARDPHVVGPRGRRAEAAALAVAGLVGTAVVGTVGRRAAELHVQVRIAAAAGHGEDQVRRAGGHGQGEVDRLAGGTRLAGHRHALAQAAGARIRLGVRGGAVAAHAAAGDRGGPVGRGQAQVAGGLFDAAGTVVEVGARGPVVAVGAGEGLERLLRVPAALVGQQVERLVVHARRIVHVHAAVIVVGMADRRAVLRRVGHVAQGAAALEDLRADQEVVATAVEVVLGGLAGHVGERLVDAAGLARVRQA